jgi:hypothetical protein
MSEISNYYHLHLIYVANILHWIFPYSNKSNIPIHIKLFEACVKPIILYCSEVWSLSQLLKGRDIDITRVRIFFFCRARREIFFQNLTLGYMIKTLYQIIFFFYLSFQVHFQMI